MGGFGVSGFQVPNMSWGSGFRGFRGLRCRGFLTSRVSEELEIEAFRGSDVRHRKDNETAELE